jgi:hypothetical protein
MSNAAQPRNAGTQLPGNPATPIQAGPVPMYNNGGVLPPFLNANLSQQLNLNQQQAQQLQTTYKGLQQRYQDAVSRLAGVPAADRPQMALQLQRALNADIARAIGTVFNQQQLVQYQQSLLQQQGIAALNQPLFQQTLNLNTLQQNRLQTLAQNFDQQLGNIMTTATMDKGAALQQYQTLRSQVDQQLMNILTPAQQQSYAQLLNYSGTQGQ